MLIRGYACFTLKLKYNSTVQLTMNQVKHENKYSLPVNNERDYDETKYGAQNHGND